MRGYTRGDNSVADIVKRRQAQMLRGRDVAKEIRSGGSGNRSANGGSDVVITRRDIGGQRPQNIKRSVIADFFLELDVGNDFRKRYMTGSFDHHLHSGGTGTGRQFAQNDQFLKLRLIRGVVYRSRPQPVAEAQYHIVLMGYFQKPVIFLVKRIFFFIAIHPVCRHGAAAADNSQDSFLRFERGNAESGYTAVDRDEINAVFAVFFDDGKDIVRCHLRYGFAVFYHFYRRLINGYGANGHG